MLIEYVIHESAAVLFERHTVNAIWQLTQCTKLHNNKWNWELITCNLLYLRRLVVAFRSYLPSMSCSWNSGNNGQGRHISKICSSSSHCCYRNMYKKLYPMNTSAIELQINVPYIRGTLDYIKTKLISNPTKCYVSRRISCLKYGCQNFRLYPIIKQVQEFTFSILPCLL